MLERCSKNNNYRSALKGTSILGGVQVFCILTNIIKGKFVAIFLGPEGMGISSLLTTSSNTIQQFSSLGLNLSIVKEISSAREAKDEDRIKLVIKIARTLLRYTALLGAIFTILFSPYLSYWTFGNEEYIWHYIFLSLVVFGTTLSNGELSILQGVHAIKRLAYSSLIGAVTGLFIGIPLYYFMGYNGIVPAMIALSLTIYLFYRYHSCKEIGEIHINCHWREQRHLIKKLVSLGLISMTALLLGTCTTYAINSFIRNFGNLTDVGLFQAANSITNQYIGLIFSTMSMDYFPRLAAVADDNQKVCTIVNQQLEIIVLIITPIIILMIITAPILIKVLLTKDFMELIPIIRIMAMSVFFKAIAFPMGYISFSKGDKKVFLLQEGICGNLLLLGMNVTAYYLWGLIGLGGSYLIMYVTYTIVYLFVTRYLYEYQMSRIVRCLIAIFGLAVIISYLSSCLSNVWLSYFLMSITLITATFFSIRELNKRIGLNTIIRQRIYK